MSREIKFRAWDRQEKKMIYNGCVGAGSSCQLIIIEWDGSGFSLANAFGLPDGSNPTFGDNPKERFELMQFTGLLDANGKEIYEGDVLCFPKFEGTKNQSRWIMEWNEKEARYSVFSPKDEAQIIGNIYENRNLLEDAK